MVVSSLIMAGDVEWVLCVRSMMVGDNFAVEGPIGLAERANLVFLRGILDKVTFFFITEGGVTNCCD